MDLTDRINNLRSKNRAKRKKINTLKKYANIFATNQSNYKAIHKQDVTACTSPSFWKGELFEEFKQLADEGLRREGYKYYLSFDNIKDQIQDKIASLESEIKNNRNKISDLQRQQKG